MSPVPEQKPMIPAVYPRPSLMSSMYLYCAFQFSEEFSALETSSIAISFLRGSVRSTRGTARLGLGLVDALALGLGLVPGATLADVLCPGLASMLVPDSDGCASTGEEGGWGWVPPNTKIRVVRATRATPPAGAISQLGIFTG